MSVMSPSIFHQNSVISAILVLSLLLNFTCSVDNADAIYLSLNTLSEPYVRHVECEYTADPPMKCWPNNCLRKVVDNAFLEKDIDNLHSIAQKGLSIREDIGGPTIIDINTGYIRDGNGLENVFKRTDKIYTEDDFTTYGNIIRQLKQHVMNSFNLTELHFTAPTFITRIDGRPSWEPQEIHDEYWHVHSDMNNTRHYHYSGLLYMSTYGTDFTGGRLHFVNRSETSQSVEIVEPKAGRMVIFSSGSENPHFVERVTSGERYVLAFWFTCTPSKRFPIFLDGKAHIKFSEDMTKDDNKKTNKDEL